MVGFNYKIVYSQLSDTHRKHGSDGAYGAINLKMYNTLSKVYYMNER